MPCYTDYDEDRAYYSIPLTEDDILYEGEISAKNIPYSRARQRMGAEMSGRRTACKDSRKRIKTPYREGDRIAYRGQANLGTSEHPSMYNIVGFGTIRYINTRGYGIGGGVVIPYRDVLGKVRKG